MPYNQVGDKIEFIQILFWVFSSSFSSPVIFCAFSAKTEECSEIDLEVI